ncbi:hypothetical protein P152DRAFT_245823 [Eremomyces bilateralis CBS 781.70]|uniref:Uncharacterized protein n=1 Tax=Eremomyces bilateralis CBS 781.70 TaxID=1392243 RepID=A0A6G1GAI8_9PEZI|nr:uncharacterized protein P152DRAFT_245823 [Eremomyces bilateralis CBS 781.70]KAF1815098.1 hypothetical protein P152DRAFT_245823 [Eremomyces bilateralis CBS 781.70]
MIHTTQIFESWEFVSNGVFKLEAFPRPSVVNHKCQASMERLLGSGTACRLGRPRRPTTLGCWITKLQLARTPKNPNRHNSVQKYIGDRWYRSDSIGGSRRAFRGLKLESRVDKAGKGRENSNVNDQPKRGEKLESLTAKGECRMAYSVLRSVTNVNVAPNARIRESTGCNALSGSVAGFCLSQVLSCFARLDHRMTELVPSCSLIHRMTQAFFHASCRRYVSRLKPLEAHVHPAPFVEVPGRFVRCRTLHMGQE